MVQATRTEVRSLRKNMTDAERKLWQLLRRRQVDGWRFRRQHPVGRYIIDFANLKNKLAIEIDGGQHTAEADKERTKFLEKNGWRVLRFWNSDVLRSPELVAEQVWKALSFPI